MKKLIHTLILTAFVCTAYSQTYYGPKHMKEVLTNAFNEHIINTPIIIEGRVHSSEFIFRESDSTLWLIKLIEIKRVLKGQEYGIKSGRIAFVGKFYFVMPSKNNHEQWDGFIERYKKPKLNYHPDNPENGENIYFLEAINDEMIPKEQIGKSDNTLRVKQYGDMFDGPGWFKDAFINCRAGSCGIDKFCFNADNKSEFIDYLKTFPGITISEQPDSIYLERATYKFNPNGPPPPKLKSSNVDNEPRTIIEMHNKLNPTKPMSPKKFQAPGTQLNLKSGAPNLHYTAENFNTKIIKDSAFFEFNFFIF